MPESIRDRLVIIGGGAAGFFAAIAAAEANPHAQVTLIEAGRQPLSKVRISGGGRCNVTHSCFDPTALVQFYPRGGKALRGAFTRFQPKDTVAWFGRRGVTLKTEADGRMFPVTDDSGTVVACLMQAAERAGVEMWTGAAVTNVDTNAVTDVMTDVMTDVSQSAAAKFLVTLKSGEIWGDRLLLATGSNPQGYRFAAQLGHHVEPPVPSLFTFNVPDAKLRSLAGVSVESVRVKLITPNDKPLEQTGALLCTHWGFSGPAVLKLSAWGARRLFDQQYRGAVQVNWLPSLATEQVLRQLETVKQEMGKRAIAAHNPFPTIPKRLWQYWLERLAIAPDTRWADLPKSAFNRLIEELTRGSYPIQGKGVFKDEFVTCGGVKLSEVDFKTMESRCCPGLYFAGEILDIDGVTGGFNFQSAWTTGWLAGQAMATKNSQV
jgi:predicted Rossmann fold flavoprotein